MYKSIFIVSLVGLAALVGCDGNPTAAADLRLVDLEGRPVDPFATDAAARVFLFTRTDCPISNRYAPEVNRIGQEFAARGVVFWLVYPDPDESPEAIRKHVAEYGYTFSPLKDPQHMLVRLTEVRVTPEAAVFTSVDNLVYRGRIDDRYVDFGKARAAPTTHDLEDALVAVLEGGTVANPRTRAVGCYIPALE